MRLLVAKAQAPLEGDVQIPPSKYHAHRALMLAALAPGESLIKDRTAARHVSFTVQALRALGTKIEAAGPGWRVTGGGFSPVADEVSVGSSGTTLYFLIGLAALGDRPVRIVGQRYFRRRVPPLRYSDGVVEIIEADDDKAAIEIARTLAGPQPMELWCLDRRVEKFPAISSGQARSG